MLPRLTHSLRTISRVTRATSKGITNAPTSTIATSPRWLHTTPTSHAMPPHHTPHTPPTPQPTIKGMLTLNKLTELVQAGTIESVIVGFPDMYGRMMGKRFDAEFFLESCAKGGTHACDYLLASDMEMVPQKGYDYANWDRGFGDFHLVPDLSSLRLASWQDGAALVLCDLQDDKTHQLVHVAPRSILRKQLERAAKTEFKVLAATELEYYTYEHSYREAAELEWSQKLLKPVGDYYEDYHLLQTAREEKYTKEFRKHLKQSGIPVENSKGECGIGQHELNIKYSDCLQMADRHLVYKQVLKEVADQQGASVTFMAKPFSDSTGSGCHIHLSLHHMDGKNAFAGDQKLGNINCSDTFKHFLAGWLKYTPDVMPFYAPTINSYKRFVSASWAPTRIAWSYDNRTAGYRVVGSGKSLRIECRIPGADVNPYLAFAGSLASGLAGIEQKLTPPEMFQGDIYQARQLPEVPKTLHEACNLMERSEFAKQAFGADVVKHYLHFYRGEQAAYDTAVTDWERKRYFERI